MKLTRRDSCPVCTGAPSVLYAMPLARLGFSYEEDFELLQCSSCTHIFQRFSGGEMVENEISLRRKTGTRLAYYKMLARRIEQATVLSTPPPHRVEGKRVLDFGCGWGRFLSLSRAYGYTVAGVEIDAERRAFCNDASIPCVANLTELGDAMFSFIQVDQVLEHIEHPLDYLSQLADRLLPDGIMYVCVPNGDDVFPLDPLKKVNQPMAHINSFTKKSLTMLGSRAGLKVVNPFSEFMRAMFVLRSPDMGYTALTGLWKKELSLWLRRV